MKLILASQSPRRKEILSACGYEFDIIPSFSKEVFDKSLNIEEALEKVAYEKAKDVQSEHEDSWIISADTIVVYENKILTKPKTERMARKYLKMLSNHTHVVYTGVCILTDTMEITFVESTKVTFRDLSDQEIDDYIQSGSCYDKAGAYGIQECDFVKEIEGSYTNVVGLPKEKVDYVLKELL